MTSGVADCSRLLPQCCCYSGMQSLEGLVQRGGSYDSQVSWSGVSARSGDKSAHCATECVTVAGGFHVREEAVVLGSEGDGAGRRCELELGFDDLVDFVV